jgi:murein DD-endopeptidase MepM/ murein hydrolase activator NlpD
MRSKASVSVMSSPKVLGVMGLLLMSACNGAPGGLDWDLRAGPGSLDTTEGASQPTANRPAADSRGIISYPTYQLALAQRGETVAGVAARLGLDAEALARSNALRPGDPLRGGEMLLLPSRVAGGAVQGGAVQGNVIGGTTGGGNGGNVDVSSIATTALDRVGTSAPAPLAAGPEPIRHTVSRGETAFSIARTYNVSARALADWNGLDADLNVREGQPLIIPPTTGGAAPASFETSAPGDGTFTPTPPTALEPLPDEETAPAAEVPKETPASPDLGETRTEATQTRFAMPVNGKIIRAYEKNEGIDISAAPGATVKAAADGTVAAVTKDTGAVSVVVVRHADNILTVYAGVDGVKVKKGDKVKRGQSLAVIGASTPSFLRFEVRRGAQSVDPMPFLQ